jgi:hypothetical protein
MTGPIDPDATRGYGPTGGDPTQPVGPVGGDPTQPVGPVGGEPTRPIGPQGPGPGGPMGPGPEEPFYDDDPRRPWWIYALAALGAGILVGVLLAVLLSGDDDEEPFGRGTTTTSTSTTTTTLPPTTVAPTAPPTTAATPPGQVTGLNAEAGAGSGEVRLTWNPVQGAVSYRIYRSSTMGTSGELIATDNDTEYIDVPGGGSWYYRVSAVNGAGLEGPRSEEECGAPVGSSC